MFYFTLLLIVQAFILGYLLVGTICDSLIKRWIIQCGFPQPKSPKLKLFTKYTLTYHTHYSGPKIHVPAHQTSHWHRPKSFRRVLCCDLRDQPPSASNLKSRITNALADFAHRAIKCAKFAPRINPHIRAIHSFASRQTRLLDIRFVVFSGCSQGSS